VNNLSTIIKNYINQVMHKFIHIIHIKKDVEFQIIVTYVDIICGQNTGCEK